MLASGTDRQQVRYRSDLGDLINPGRGSVAHTKLLTTSVYFAQLIQCSDEAEPA